MLLSSLRSFRSGQKNFPFWLRLTNQHVRQLLHVLANMTIKTPICGFFQGLNDGIRAHKTHHIKNMLKMHHCGDSLKNL